MKKNFLDLLHFDLYKLDTGGINIATVRRKKQV